MPVVHASCSPMRCLAKDRIGLARNKETCLKPQRVMFTNSLRDSYSFAYLFFDCLLLPDGANKRIVRK